MTNLTKSTVKVSSQVKSKTKKEKTNKQSNLYVESVQTNLTVPASKKRAKRVEYIIILSTLRPGPASQPRQARNKTSSKYLCYYILSVLLANQLTRRRCLFQFSFPSF